MFVRALAYADDIVLISPTIMRLTLNVYDQYATDFNVVFNAIKSTCLVNRHVSACGNVEEVCFLLVVILLRFIQLAFICHVNNV